MEQSLDFGQKKTKLDLSDGHESETIKSWSMNSEANSCGDLTQSSANLDTCLYSEVESYSQRLLRLPSQDEIDIDRHSLTQVITYLHDFICLNETCQILTCRACFKPFATVAKIIGHCKSKHYVKFDQPEIEKLEETQMLPPRKFKISDSPKFHKVLGLFCEDGFKCPDCDYCSRIDRSVKNHCTSSGHSTNLECCLIQSFENGKNFFAVEEICNIQPQGCSFANLQNSFDEFIQKSDADREKLIDNENMELWNVKLSIEDRIILSKWADCNQDSRFDGLKRLVLSYFKEIQDLIVFSDYFVKLAIAQDAVDDEGENHKQGRKPFRKLQEESSVAQYALYAYRFVCFLINCNDQEMIMDKTINDCTEVLIESLTIFSLHQLFRSVFQKKYSFKIREKDTDLFKFMVVSNCDSRNGTIQKASYITPKLAMLRYLCRGCLLYEFNKDNDINMEEDSDVAAEMFENQYAVYLKEGYRTPYNMICQELGYAYFVASREDIGTKIVWAPDLKSCHIYGKQISIQKLKDSCSSLIETATKIFSKLFLDQGDLNQEIILWTESDFDNRNVGYSFLSEKSGLRRMDSTKMFSLLVSNIDHPDNPLYLNKCNEEFEFNPAKSRLWLMLCDNLMEILFVLYHISCGMPARATEIQKFVYRNTDCQKRNIFLYNGKLMTVQFYHKNKFRSGDSNVARFLPVVVSQLYYRLFAYIRPLYDYILINVLQEKDVNINAVWVKQGKAISASSLCEVFRTKFKEHAQLCDFIKFSEFRDIQQAFGELLLPQHAPADIFELLHRQSGHSLSTGLSNYARSQRDISGSNRFALYNFEMLSNSWHSVLGLTSDLKKNRVKDVKGVNAEAEHSLESKESKPHVSIVQNYIITQPDSIDLVQQPDNLVSKDLSMMFEIAKTMKSRFGFSTFSSPQQSSALYNICIGVDNVLTVMPTGSGKSLLYLLPSCFDELASKTTIVVVPFVSLKHQVLLQCKKYGISCGIWSTDLSPLSSPTIVIVSVENAVDDQFIEFCQSISNEQKLARIILDEGHLYLRSENLFRAEYFSNISKLSVLSVPIVLMTATLPPDREKWIGIYFQRKFLTIRQPTVKNRTKYSVSILENEGQILEHIIRILSQCETGQLSLIFVRKKDECLMLANILSSKGRNAAAFHSEIHEESKKIIMQQAISAQLDVIISTSALSTGVDIPVVKNVIHIGPSFGFIDYAQECGRAGRSNRDAFCTTLLLPGDLNKCCGRWRSFLLDTKHCRREMMHSFLDGSSVCCFELDNCILCDNCENNGFGQIEIFDDIIKGNNEMTGELSDESRHETSESLKNSNQFIKTLPTTKVDKTDMMQICDNHKPKTYVTESISKKASQAMSQGEVDKIIDNLKALKAYGCVVCNFNGLRNSHINGLAGCPLVKKDNLCYRCLKFKEIGGCKMQRAICACFNCGLPTLIDGNFVHKNDQWGHTCDLDLKDTILPLCWMIWRNESKRQIITKEMAIPIDDIRLKVTPSTEDRAFNEWMFMKTVRGIPNTIILFNFARAHKWIQLSQ